MALCEGISAQQQTEVVNNTEMRYWSVTANLHFRKAVMESTYPMSVTTNWLSGQLKPCTVTHQGDEIPATKACASYLFRRSGSNRTMPTIDYYETHAGSDFTTLFGTPPSY